MRKSQGAHLATEGRAKRLDGLSLASAGRPIGVASIAEGERLRAGGPRRQWTVAWAACECGRPGTASTRQCLPPHPVLLCLTWVSARYALSVSGVYTSRGAAPWYSQP